MQSFLENLSQAIKQTEGNVQAIRDYLDSNGTVVAQPPPVIQNLD